MNTREAYDRWADTYDSVLNKTRDLEALAIREILGSLPFSNALEIGCGTGKNTGWLMERSASLIAADFSAEMLARAKQKINAPTVRFLEMDIRREWAIPARSVDLVTFSLVLEHIEDLDAVFSQAAQALKAGGYLYVSELHPFRQYLGSKARFETENGTLEPECFTHHVSDYFNAGMTSQLNCQVIREWFDNDGENSGIPRILTMLFRKPV